MSGGGGGGYPGPTRTRTDCNIVESVPLNSPSPTVLPIVKVGDTLDVVEQKKVLVALHNGAVAGSLTPASLLDLLDCIAKGKVYVAHVTHRAGGLCQVEIRPK